MIRKHFIGEETEVAHLVGTVGEAAEESAIHPSQSLETDSDRRLLL